MNTTPVYQRASAPLRHTRLARAKGRGSAGQCPDVAHASKTPAVQERARRVAAAAIGLAPPPQPETDASTRATAPRCSREVIV